MTRTTLLVTATTALILLVTLALLLMGLDLGPGELAPRYRARSIDV